MASDLSTQRAASPGIAGPFLWGNFHVNYFERENDHHSPADRRSLVICLVRKMSGFTAFEIPWPSLVRAGVTMIGIGIVTRCVLSLLLTSYNARPSGLPETAKRHDCKTGKPVVDLQG